MPPEEWLDVGANFQSRLAEKHSLLASHHDKIFMARPEALEASREFLAMLRDYLRQYHPGVPILEDSGLHPLDFAARMVIEDFCLLLPSNDDYYLAAASLHAPSGWQLGHKIGKTLSQLHAEVPHYPEQLSAGVQNFFRSYKAGKSNGRFNWGIFTDPALFQPQRLPPARPVTAENAGQNLWLRAERQMFHRLPQSNAMIFTIHTDVRRLDEVIETPQDAEDLALAISRMSPELKAYKAIDLIEAPLAGWLRR